MEGGVRDFGGCACVQRVEEKGVQQAVGGIWRGKRRAGAMQESEQGWLRFLNILRRGEKRQPGRAENRRTDTSSGPAPSQAART